MKLIWSSPLIYLSLLRHSSSNNRVEKFDQMQLDYREPSCAQFNSPSIRRFSLWFAVIFIWAGCTHSFVFALDNSTFSALSGFPHANVAPLITPLGGLDQEKNKQNNSGSDLPNIILINCDDMGYGDLQNYGNPKIRTPNINQLGKEGVRFTDFYVAQPVCSASRTALLSSCYPNRLGILGALGPNARHGISSKETLIPKMLKSKGYHTMIIGKWHLGSLPEFLPTRHGFDEYYGLPYSNDMIPGNGRNFPDLPLYENEKVMRYNPDQDLLTSEYTQRALTFIQKHHDQPFFIYLAHAMPHVPIHASTAFRDKSMAGLYGDVIEEIDAGVGKILAQLKKDNLDKKTLVIFTSDNGPWLIQGKNGGYPGPLREGKATTFEGGIRVPCLMRWPGVIPEGKISKEPVMTIDLLPTFAEITGAELPKLPIDGKSILPIMKESIDAKIPAKSPHEALFFYWNNELQAVRMGKWKLHFPHTYNHVAKFSEGKGDGKSGKKMPKSGMIFIPEKIALSLYNLEEDIGETKEVSKEHPEIVAQIQKLADKMREDLGDSLQKINGNGKRPSPVIKDKKKKNKK